MIWPFHAAGVALKLIAIAAVIALGTTRRQSPPGIARDMDVSTLERGVYLFGPFRLDPIRRTLLRRGVQVSLAPRLFDTLHYIIANHERLVEKGELIAAVWGRRTVEETNLSQAVFALRKVLQTEDVDGNIIVTAPGRGYRCGVPVVFEVVAADRSAAGSDQAENNPIIDRSAQ